jgi:hypothetical protein
MRNARKLKRCGHDADEGSLMIRKPAAKPDDPEQSKRFIDAAKEAQADETEKGAERAFKKVVSAKLEKSKSD